MQEIQELRKQVAELTKWREAVIAHSVYNNLYYSLTEPELTLDIILDRYELENKALTRNQVIEALEEFFTDKQEK